MYETGVCITASIGISMVAAMVAYDCYKGFVAFVQDAEWTSCQPYNDYTDDIVLVILFYLFLLIISIVAGALWAIVLPLGIGRAVAYFVRSIVRINKKLAELNKGE